MTVTHYTYCTPFGDDLAIVTGKSAARGRGSTHNLRIERREMLKRLAALRALAGRRWNAVKGLLATVERLTAENVELKKMVTTLDKRGYAVACKCDKLSRRLHDCRVDRRKWRDTAERCFAAAMKNSVALANERKGERGE